jgi:hypothetical protein
MTNTINYTLYFFNSMILLFGVILFSYYSNTNIHNKTLVDLNCGDTYFLSFMTLVNSIVCLASIQYIKMIGSITTIAIFSYNSYNIKNISSECIIISNNVWYYYLFSIIVNGFNILIYLLSLLVYIRNKKKNKVYIVNYNTNENIEQNRIYDVNNNLLENDNNVLENDNIYE